MLTTAHSRASGNPGRLQTAGSTPSRGRAQRELSIQVRPDGGLVRRSFLLRRDLMHCRSFPRAPDHLNRLLDRLPQPRDLYARARIERLFLDALASGNGERVTYPVGDLAAPNRNIELRQAFARRGDDRRLDIFALGRCAVENDRVGGSEPAGQIDCLRHVVDVKETRTARYDDKSRRTDCVNNAGGDIGGRVDKDPVHVPPLRLLQDVGEFSFDPLDRKRGRLAQRVPQRQRSLRILINQQTTLQFSVRVQRKMRGLSALPRATFSRRKCKDVHTPPTEGAAARTVAIRSIAALLRLRHPGQLICTPSGEDRVYDE